MAIASITITCRACGATFTLRKECYNRREADSYVVWAQNNISNCPDCAKRERSEKMAIELETLLSEFGYILPNIDGASDKQIAYANTVRLRYLHRNMRYIRKYHKGMQSLKDPEVLASTQASCDAAGITLEEGIVQSLKAAGLYEVHIALSSTNARNILDCIH